MTTMVQPTDLRTIDLGTYVTKDYTLSAAETASLFTVTGLVIVTSLVGVVTTAITVANTVKLQANPTDGGTEDLCLATDLGTDDTPAGNLLGITGDNENLIMTYTGMMPRFPAYEGGARGIFINAGAIEIVTTGAALDGVISWHLTYVPVTDTGKVVAA